MAKYFNVKASAEKIRIDIYGDIVADRFWKWSDDDRCPGEISDAIKNNPGAAVDIHINSGGGDAFAGMAIFNILKAHNGKKTVFVDGIAASSASVIAMAADPGELYVPKTAQLMVHRPWTSIFGANEDDLTKVIDMLKSVKESLIAAYMSRTAEGVEESTIRAIVDAETWMTGEKAMDYFDVKLVDVAAAACTSDLIARYANTPPELKDLPAAPVAGGAKPLDDPTPNPEPPASDEMTVGDELEIMSSFIFAQREELNNE